MSGGFVPKNGIAFLMFRCPVRNTTNHKESVMQFTLGSGFLLTFSRHSPYDAIREGFI